MPHFWLQVAVMFYSAGLLYALAGHSGWSKILGRFILPAVAIGTLFHFVALSEVVLATGQLTPVSIYHSESLLAFVLMVFFFGVYWRYKTPSPGIIVFPIVFLLTLTAVLGQEPPKFTSPLFRSGWIFTHIALIFCGYAALFFSFISSIFYLVQERQLKSKDLNRNRLFTRLPALAVMDDIGLRSLIIGFPFMTVGLIAGSVLAQERFGPVFFRDPKVVLSLMMWAVYLVLLFTRWNAGWRGRRAAILSTVAFLAATVTWAANYFSSMHRFVNP